MSAQSKPVKAFSYLIVAASLLSKVPQILRIFRTSSIDGVSPYMYALEILSYTISVLYHAANRFPIRTYADKVSFAAQGILILLQFVHYAKLPYKPLLNAGLVAYVLLAFYISKNQGKNAKIILGFLQGLSTPLYILSRFVQISKNANSRRTGELSPVPFAINFLGAVSRFATTLIELKGDYLLVFDYAVRIVLNFIMVYQIYSFSSYNVAKTD